MQNPFDIIISRHRTEKAGVLENLAQAKGNPSLVACDQSQYVFIVHPSASKPTIARAVESIYSGVKVTSVNTIKVKRKPKRRTKHGRGMASSYKKAIVTLASGNQLND